MRIVAVHSIYENVSASWFGVNLIRTLDTPRCVRFVTDCVIARVYISIMHPYLRVRFNASGCIVCHSVPFRQVYRNRNGVGARSEWRFVHKPDNIVIVASYHGAVCFDDFEAGVGVVRRKRERHDPPGVEPQKIAPLVRRVRLYSGARYHIVSREIQSWVVQHLYIIIAKMMAQPLTAKTTDFLRFVASKDEVFLNVA